MHLVTLRQVDPIGIWVDEYPVIVPFFDSILVPDEKAFDLAEEWSTDVFFLSKVADYDYMVYLPKQIVTNVRYCADRLRLI
jgi:hypothetical protein